jgi:hypothetical protein
VWGVRAGTVARIVVGVAADIAAGNVAEVETDIGVGIEEDNETAIVEGNDAMGVAVGLTKEVVAAEWQMQKPRVPDELYTVLAAASYIALLYV